MKRILADRTDLIQASGIRKIAAMAAAIEDPINFSIGAPDFDVPEPLKQAAIKAIAGGSNSYTTSAGNDLLREKLTSQAKEEFGWANPSVLVTCGVSGALVIAFMATINPGDEVIIPEPSFSMYRHLVNMAGGRPVLVDSYPDFDLPVEAIAKAITERTKMIIVNSPNNPTGVVYSVERLKELAKVAKENDVLIVDDEIYEKFCYDGDCPSIANYYNKVLLMRGFSKAYGMPGWRLGWVATDECLSEVIEGMLKIQQYTFVCAPTPLQQAAISAIDYDISEYIAAYKKKRDIVYEGLKDKFEMVKPGGGFYAFPKVPAGSATQFVERAIANKVMIVPGDVFSPRDTHFRISYTTTDDKIHQGVDILRSLV